MPLYNYACQSHGEFESWRSMSECEEPAPCPACGLSAPRAVSAPWLANMDGATRKAHSINERSADQPVIETRVPAGEGGHDKQHGHDHGHKHPHKHGHGHGHGPKRPWMIGH